LIAAEQGRDIQEILAEALNMVFARYGIEKGSAGSAKSLNRGQGRMLGGGRIN
jgi:hypothetical protein